MTLVESGGCYSQHMQIRGKTFITFAFCNREKYGTMSYFIDMMLVLKKGNIVQNTFYPLQRSNLYDHQSQPPCTN